MPSFTPNAQQQKFFEVSDWALNGNLNRGSGKSFVMAYAAVQMAIRGARVFMYDPSLVYTHGVGYTTHSHFRHTIMEVARVYFPEFEFEFAAVANWFRCIGTRVPSVPIPTPVPAENFDDDGSDENA